MKEPRRLSQSGGVSQRLLESASLDKPGPAARRHAAALASTASSFARTSSGNSSAHLRPSNAAKTLAAWIVVGAAASVALGLVGSRLLSSTGAPPAVSLATLPTLSAPVAAKSPEISAEPAVSLKLPIAPSPNEIAAIEAARAAVSRGDAASAIAQLNDFDSSHPQERLKPEALALRIQALRISGKLMEARALENEFRAKYPNHPLPSVAR